MVRTQYLRPKMLRLDKESFLDGESGLEYLLEEMDKQAKEAPIVKLDDSQHNQDHLAGWKAGARDVSTLAEWREEAKDYDGCPENEILEKHFATYLKTRVFKLEERPRLTSFTDKNKPDINMISTSMETVRIGGCLYIIVSGHIPHTLQ
jgi:hypothetical protein